MNILMIGDVVGSGGCQFLRSKLPAFKRLKSVDLVVCNGENSADGNGITPSSAGYLFDSGVDVITTGNHAFRRREVYDLFESEPFLLRPANFPSSAPGKGFCVVDKGRVQICVANIMGTVYLESLACPFETADRILNSTPEARISVVDFHAEATGEKRALGYYLDGRASVTVGTHTHVQTADCCVLPGGSGRRHFGQIRPAPTESASPQAAVLAAESEAEPHFASESAVSAAAVSHDLCFK